MIYFIVKYWREDLSHETGYKEYVLQHLDINSFIVDMTSKGYYIMFKRDETGILVAYINNKMFKQS